MDGDIMWTATFVAPDLAARTLRDACTRYVTNGVTNGGLSTSPSFRVMYIAVTATLSMTALRVAMP
jgi:hypothetical protein